MSTYTLRDRGHDLAVQTWTERGKRPNRARLLVDGRQVDEGRGEEIGDLRLGRDTEHHTRVSWWWTGRVAGVALIEEGVAEERHRRVPYAPPPGTRAARLHAWGEAHPRLWATRHVVSWGAGVLAGVVGVGLVLQLLLSWVGFGWLPDPPELPSVPWPDAPAWWTALWTWVGQTLTWLADLLLGWIPDAHWVKYVVGFLVAVGIAVREARKRERRRDQDPR